MMQTDSRICFIDDDGRHVRFGMAGLNMHDTRVNRNAGGLTRDDAGGPTGSECLFLVLITVDSSSLQ